MEQKSDKHFMPCLNENCNNYHLVSDEELEIFKKDNNYIDLLLCDDCKSRRNVFHILQCLSCKTILDFLPTLDDETPQVIYVEKCMNCGGSIEDEIKIISNLHKHLFI
ncbi:MAG: hypothetical protein HPY57_07745 [Ignavibacteria bacterium]|nr:hypothetical protein [Ignavibacteria bacterium]